MVIENHPRMDTGAPFPTLYWLTCPILVKRMSTLEGDGWMQVVNDELERDPSLRARLSDAVTAYRSRRDQHEPVEDSGGPPGGGPDRVKCLHAHVAHELAGGANPIGTVTIAATGWPDCIAPCVPVDG